MVADNVDVIIYSGVFIHTDKEMNNLLDIVSNEKKE